MKRILVLGATGMLGAPTARQLNNDGFMVRLLARDPQKANHQLGGGFEIFAGDITDLECLKEAMAGCQGVHISVGGSVDQQSAENVVSLAPDSGTERITYVSGATAYEQNRWFPMTEQKLNAEDSIRKSGLPFTFFCPTWPMEQIPRLAMGGNPMIIGDRQISWHWFAANDLAQMISNAYQNDSTINKKLVIHGPEALTMVEAVKQYCEVFHPEVQEISMMPIKVARSIATSTGNHMLNYFADLMAYFDTVGEMGDPTEANQLLGKPLTTLEQWIKEQKNSDA